ncbi:hypothetical protein [Streptomyces sp. NPDC002763]|uniref:SCO4225 family membrane protein n=1 Tax=Streptomyces sp. NPDC002763 TaxID=3154427 RepID=UPI00332BFBFE
MESGPARTLVRLVRLMCANRLSAAYLALVAVVIAKATVGSLPGADPGTDYAWLWAPVVTFPTFPLVSAIGGTAWDTDAPNRFFVGMIVVSALLQALALGALREAVLARHRRAIHSP